jgi:hypothetical protein
MIDDIRLYIQSPGTVRNQVHSEPIILARLVASWEMSGEAEATDMGSHASHGPRRLVLEAFRVHQTCRRSCGAADIKTSGFSRVTHAMGSRGGRSRSEGVEKKK